MPTLLTTKLFFTYNKRVGFYLQKNGVIKMKQQPNENLKRSLGFTSALSIVIGTIIGSGIFFKQASVLDSAGSSALAILAWILGGITTLTSGLTIAEIGAQMPYTGGLYIFILKTSMAEWLDF